MISLPKTIDDINDQSNQKIFVNSNIQRDFSNSGPVKMARTLAYRYVICLIIFLSYILVFFHRLCPAVIALEMQETFRISGTLLGVLASAYFYPYALMQVPSGILADYWGPRKTVTTFFVLAAFGSILMGMAPNLPMAILGRILVGFGVSVLFVSNFKLLSEWFSPRGFTVMGGVFLAMGGIGALSSSLPLAWASNLVGWRVTLVIVGGITLMMAFLLYGFVRDRPSDMGLAPIGTRERATDESRVGLSRGMKLVVTSPRFWALSIWGFCTAGVSFALGGLWGGPYLIHVYGLSKTAAGQVLSMFAAALIVGGPLSGWAANRAGRKPILMGCSALLTAVCACFYAFTDELSLPLLYVLYFLLFLGAAAPAPVFAAAGKELFPASMAGISIGTLNILPFLGGAVLQVFTGTILARRASMGPGYALAGYRDMFLLYLLVSVFSLVASFFLKETLIRRNSALFPSSGAELVPQGQ
jgi:sugar phosphate permease